jgi:lysophospholipase L1-like esterase
LNRRRAVTSAAVVALLTAAALIGVAGPSQADNSATDVPDPDGYICNQPGYVNFEELADATDLSADTIQGVKFTTTNGFTWKVGDFSTGSYNGRYPNGAYMSQGTHWAWLGQTQGAGRIDFTEGPAAEFGLLVSVGASPVVLEGYDSANNLLETAGPANVNTSTGHMTELRLSRPTRDLAYVVVHDQGNFFLVDGICTDAPGVRRPLRYVAFGDSIPYGHGLANPGKKSRDKLPANQPPSRYAYPTLVADGLGYTLTMRKSACLLEGDQLAVSGAPSTVNRWTDLDRDCRYPKGEPVPLHKAVVPDEVAAAELRSNPPSLATLQAGANDLDFDACLGSLLGFPLNPFAHVENCIRQDKSRGGYKVTSKVAAELRSLRTGLGLAIDLIEGAAPDAEVVVLNYYQIVPKADAPLRGTSTICRDLRASRPNGKWRRTIRAKADFLQKQLNDTIASVVADHPDVKLVDISDLFSGHELCTTSTWLLDGLWNAAHPTRTGHAQMASAVLAACETLPGRCRGGSSATQRRAIPAPELLTRR